jgi:probable rRNA maturation factor
MKKMNVMTKLSIEISSSERLIVDVQIALDETALEESDIEEPPSSALLANWARLAYAWITQNDGAIRDVTIRIVDRTEMISLNDQYRNKDAVTNVLSFAVQLVPELIEELDTLPLGDIVICHSVVVAEAKSNGKKVHDHYAHMVTHGVLHLCGYDHQNDKSADEMELVEAEILTLSAISNPYIS